MHEAIKKVLDERRPPGLSKELERGEVVVAETRDGFALQSRDLAEALSTWFDVGEPSSAGEAWGAVVGETWRMTIAAASRIGGPDDCVVLRDEAAQRFLYGRGVRPNDIQARRTPRGPGERVFVCDRFGNVLGLAFIEATSNGLGLRPLLDLGWYLREGG